MSSMGLQDEVDAASAKRRSEPRLHSRVIGRLPDDHLLATSRVSCERCETTLHEQNNSCVRTWVESGQGNYCLYCFVVAAGELAPAYSSRLTGGGWLAPTFGLELDRASRDEGDRRLSQMRLTSHRNPDHSFTPNSDPIHPAP
jgi:hypothetical protein